MTHEEIKALATRTFAPLYADLSYGIEGDVLCVTVKPRAFKRYLAGQFGADKSNENTLAEMQGMFDVLIDYVFCGATCHDDGFPK